jgi:hypothetical protein
LGRLRAVIRSSQRKVDTAITAATMTSFTPRRLFQL